MSSPHPHFRAPTNESSTTRFVLVTAAVLYIGIFLLTPLIAVFTEGFRNGTQAFLNAITEKDAFAAVSSTIGCWMPTWRSRGAVRRRTARDLSWNSSSSRWVGKARRPKCYHRSAPHSALRVPRSLDLV